MPVSGDGIIGMRVSQVPDWHRYHTPPNDPTMKKGPLMTATQR